MKERYGIIADDLTGACDIGAEFIDLGWKVSVALTPDNMEKLGKNSDLVVVDTETRTKGRGALRRLLGRVINGYKKLGVKNIFLKIDTAFRGNVGILVETTMQVLGSRVAFVIPAIPSMGRYTINGVQFRDGIPMDRVDLSDDAGNSITESRVSALLNKTTDLKIENVTISDIEQGKARRKIEKFLKEGVKIIVCDSKRDEQIENLIRIIFKLKVAQLIIGSIGAGKQVARYLGKQKDTNPLCILDKGNLSQVSHLNKEPGGREGFLPMLVIAGSCNSVTRRQVEYADTSGIKTIEIDAGKMKKEEIIDGALLKAGALLEQKQDIIVSTKKPQVRSSGIQREIIADVLAEIATGLSTKHHIRAMLMTGGNTAYSICHRMGAEGIQLQKMIVPGIISGYLIGGKYPELPVVTKGGSVGSSSIFKDIAFNSFRC